MKISQPLRVDYPADHSSFVTRRFRNSQLLFLNKNVEKRVLAALGKYCHKYDATIYAYTMFGSHDHPMISFKPQTKSSFYKDFGARTAEAVKKFIPDYGTGSVFERRPSEQAITPGKETHLDRLMYTVLQPIAEGLVKNLSDYPGFNSFKYILSGKPLTVEFFNGSAYRRAKRKNKNADPRKFIEYYDLTFARLPGYEDMSQREYRALLLAEFEKRRAKIIAELEASGHVWPPLERIQRTRATEYAKNPKRSERNSKRPLVLSLCEEAKQWFLTWYFTIVTEYRAASLKYLAGDASVQFPSGTHKPPGPIAA